MCGGDAIGQPSNAKDWLPIELVQELNACFGFDKPQEFIGIL